MTLMINATSNSHHLYVTCQTPQYIPCGGVVKWNQFHQYFEVESEYGTISQLPSPSLQVCIPDDTANAIEWAIKKMKQEQSINELCNKHAGLKDAKERFEIMLQLVQKDTNETNS